MGALDFTRTGGKPDNSLTAISMFPGAFRGKVINVTWAQLQPTAQRFVPDAIDAALSDIATYNANHPDAPLLAKLRVSVGGSTPDWVKQIGGPIAVIHQPSGSAPIGVTVGAFWSQPYIQVWRTLQGMLAMQYDANPLIAVVASSSCATITDEPFVLPLAKLSSTNLIAAGFTDAAYRDCLIYQTDDYAAWKSTRIEVTYNPYHLIQAGTAIQDDAVTVQAIDQCRAALGERCVLGNHCLGRCEGEANFGPIYARIRQLGAPIGLQTAAPTWLTLDPARWNATLTTGINDGAASIEIWPRGFTQYLQSTVQQWAALFPVGNGAATAPVVAPASV